MEVEQNGRGSPQPSTSYIWEGRSNSRGERGCVSDEEWTDVEATRTHKKKTSTPKKKLKLKVGGAPKRRKQERKVPSLVPKVLEEAKKKLDSGRFVSLSPDSSFDVSEAVVNEDDEGEAREPLEFESLDSSVLSELHVILNDLNSPQVSPDWDSSDPDVTRLLLGLMGETGEKISNPFDLAENVRRELVARAERAGTRALSWDFSHFDKVGGKGTVMSMWRRLKSDERVGGKKRSMSSVSDEEATERKKLKLSLNISDTCNKIQEIELSLQAEKSAVLSILDYSREESDLDGSRKDGYSDEDVEILQARDLFQVSIGGGAESNGNQFAAFNYSSIDEMVVGLQVSESESYMSSDNLLLTSGTDSVPDLATTESLSSDDDEVDTDRDSGISDRQIGNVTDLCRQRRVRQVRTGIVTETGPYIPVSLGFSNDDNGSDSWEELLDDNGQPTGMEIRSFRLNIVNGSTESIDEETSKIRRACGVGDGTNNRWYARNGMNVEQDGSDVEYEYQADVSFSSSDEEESQVNWGRGLDGGSQTGDNCMLFGDDLERVMLVDNALFALDYVNGEGGEEDEVPVEGKDILTEADEGREEEEVPVEGMKNLESGRYREMEEWARVHYGGGEERVPVEYKDNLVTDVRGREEDEVPVEGDDEKLDMWEWWEGVTLCVCMMIANLVVISVILGYQVAIYDILRWKASVTEREWDVNGAVLGGGSGTVSLPMVRQGAEIVADRLGDGRNRKEDSEVMVVGNRIQNENISRQLEEDDSSGNFSE